MNDIYYGYSRLNVGEAHPGTGHVVTQHDIDDDNLQRLIREADAAEEHAARLRFIAHELSLSIYARREQKP
ncbi:hypothetical protein [Pseudomonas sp. B10(2017)]|uniref:hypothetical protein n=1 Tax=Pseudomonas sp. B10(2017) TaxID=1981749 RepID=UPI000A1F2AAA|nr:hypothetical protein [Pseudomonas sp. B10(2017)]